MDIATIEERWAKVGRGEPLVPSPEPSIGSNKYYRPLDEACDEYVHWAQTPQERIYLGFPDLDAQMRGVANGEMCLINGYSHSGKTLFLLQILIANKDKTIVYFCPDEPRTLTLIKLACVTHGIDGNTMEREIAENNPNAIQLLRETANKHFPNLAVFDQSMTLSDMEKALGEVVDMWGKPALMVFDYLELLSGGGEDVPSKANTMKAFGKRHNIPLIVLHQSSRSAGADGKKMTISSGAYGGEQQATHIIGVRRKKFDIEAQIRMIEEKLDKSQASEKLLERLDMLRYEQRIHANTITVNLVKCKRPASQLIDDIDFEIEHGTGRLIRMDNMIVPVDRSANANVDWIENEATDDAMQIVFDEDWR